MRFSMTTNGTLITPEDAALFAAHRFNVAISIDGDRAENDRVRRLHNGRGSYDRIVAGLETLNRHGRPRHLSARVTVTPRTAELARTLDHIIGLRLRQRWICGRVDIAESDIGIQDRRFWPLPRRNDRTAVELHWNDSRRGSAIRSATLRRRCTKSTGARIGPIRAGQVPVISARTRRAVSSLVIGWSIRPNSRWEICIRAPTGRGVRSISRAAMSIGWRPATVVGRATCAAAAAITKSPSAVATVAIIFAVGLPFVSRAMPNFRKRGPNTLTAHRRALRRACVPIRWQSRGEPCQANKRELAIPGYSPAT